MIVYPRRDGLMVGLALLAGLLLGAWSFSGPPEGVLSVDFENATDHAVQSLTIDHGNANTQERIQLLQIPAQTTRHAVLNHEPGAGFNVTVKYADGHTVEFCANRGVEGRRQSVTLYR
ncbi:MAG: hypothetical protein ACQERG_02725 [Pseudomonadota bacterium]